MSKDVITGSRGPTAIGSIDEHDDEPTTVADVSAEEQAVVPVASEALGFKGAGDRDWTDVHNRVLTIAGLGSIGVAGTLAYSEDALDDEGVEKLEGQLQKAGAAPGAGRAIGNAAKQMGYGVAFKAG